MNLINLISTALSNSKDPPFVCSNGLALPHSNKLRKELANYGRRMASNAVCDKKEDCQKLEKKIKRARKALKHLEKIKSLQRGLVQVEIGAGHGILSMIWAYLTKQPVISTDIMPWCFKKDDEGQRCESLQKVTREWLSRQSPRWRSDIQMLAMDARQMCIADESVDLFFSENTFEHIIGCKALFAEIHRCLKPGGVLYAKWSNFYSLFGCHVPGLTGIPWGHALIPPADLKRYCGEVIGGEKGEAIFKTIGSLNKNKLDEWIGEIAHSGLNILDIEEMTDDFLEDMDMNKIIPFLPEGLTLRDLKVSDIIVVAQK